MSSSMARHLPPAVGDARPSGQKRLDRCEQLTASEEPADVCSTSCECSDEALISLVCECNNEALAILFRRYSPLIRGIAYRVLRDRAEADDLLQDVFVLIPRLSSKFDSSKGTVRSWLLQLTYHRAINRRRYLNNRHFYNHLDVDEVADGVADQRYKPNNIDQSIDGLFGAGTEEELVAELSKNQSQTLRLFFSEGYTFDEIAVKMSQSLGNVRHHYSGV